MFFPHFGVEGHFLFFLCQQIPHSRLSTRFPFFARPPDTHCPRRIQADYLVRLLIGAPILVPPVALQSHLCLSLVVGRGATTLLLLPGPLLAKDVVMTKSSVWEGSHCAVLPHLPVGKRFVRFCLV